MRTERLLDMKIIFWSLGYKETAIKVEVYFYDFLHLLYKFQII